MALTFVAPATLADLMKHNYGPMVLAFIEQHEIAPGYMGHLHIDHDDWCAIFQGGYCNCEPVMTFYAEAESPDAQR